MRSVSLQCFRSAASLIVACLLPMSLACSDAQKQQLENRVKSATARVLNPEKACVERLSGQRKDLLANRDALFPDDATPPKTPEDVRNVLHASSLKIASFAELLDNIDVTECPADIKLAHVATGSTFRTVADVLQKSADSLSEPSKDTFDRTDIAWVAEDKLIAQYLSAH